jgi:hypothetical protein
MPVICENSSCAFWVIKAGQQKKQKNRDAAPPPVWAIATPTLRGKEDAAGILYIHSWFFVI